MCIRDRFSGVLRAMRGKGRIIVSAVEHPSVYETALTYKSAGYDVVFAQVDGNGDVYKRQGIACLSCFTTSGYLEAKKHGRLKISRSFSAF